MSFSPYLALSTLCFFTNNNEPELVMIFGGGERKNSSLIKEHLSTHGLFAFLLLH